VRLGHGGMRRVTAAGQSSVSPPSFAATIVERTSRRRGSVLADRDGEFSGVEFAGMVSRLARSLARHGVGSEHRLAIVAPGSAEALATRYAAALLGAATAVCPADRRPVEVARFVAAVGADVVLADEQAAESCSLVVHGEAIRLVVGLGPVEGADVDLRAAAALEVSTAIGTQSGPDDLALVHVRSGRVLTHTFRSWRSLLDEELGAGGRQVVCSGLGYGSQLLADRTLLGDGRVILRASEPDM
jgi:non-ribosomal peptide synthetase component E (peptide arylation enzyme)